MAIRFPLLASGTSSTSTDVEYSGPTRAAVLFEGSSDSSDIALSDDWTNYDFLIIYAGNDGESLIQECIINTETMIDAADYADGKLTISIGSGSDWVFDMTSTDYSTLTHQGDNGGRIYRVTGCNW